MLIHQKRCSGTYLDQWLAHLLCLASWSRFAHPGRPPVRSAQSSDLCSSHEYFAMQTIKMTKSVVHVPWPRMGGTAIVQQRPTQKKGIALGAGGHICWHMKRVNKRRQNSYLDWFIRLVYTFTFTFHKTLHDCLSVGRWPTMRHKCYQPSHHLLIFSYFSVVRLAKCYVFVTV